jgi:hypothetical protein
LLELAGDEHHIIALDAIGMRSGLLLKRSGLFLQAAPQLLLCAGGQGCFHLVSKFLFGSGVVALGEQIDELLGAGDPLW